MSKKYIVICYAIHDTDIASHDVFDTYDEALDFLKQDVKSVYDDEVDNRGNGSKDISYNIDENDMGTVVDFPAGCQWTWHIVEVDC